MLSESILNQLSELLVGVALLGSLVFIIYMSIP